MGTQCASSDFEGSQILLRQFKPKRESRRHLSLEMRSLKPYLGAVNALHNESTVLRAS
jgi:hypothetical protein